MRRAAGLLLFVAFVGLVGCAARATPDEFNNKIAKANRKLALDARVFRANILQLKAGTVLGEEKRRAKYHETLRANYQQLANDLEEAKATQATLLPPRWSKPGNQFLKDWGEFLANEETLLGKLGQMIQIVEDDKKFPTPAEKWTKVEELLKEIESNQKSQLTALAEAQTQFCGDNKVKPVATYGGAGGSPGMVPPSPAPPPPGPAPPVPGVPPIKK